MQFCETCPARGDCVDDIKNVVTLTTTATNPFTYWVVEEDRTFTYIETADEQNRHQIVRKFGIVTAEEVKVSIEDCHEPQIEKSIIQISVPVCGALGRVSVISIGRFEVVKSWEPVKQRLKRWKQEWREAKYGRQEI